MNLPSDYCDEISTVPSKSEDKSCSKNVSNDLFKSNTTENNLLDESGEIVMEIEVNSLNNNIHFDEEIALAMNHFEEAEKFMSDGEEVSMMNNCILDVHEQ